MLLLKAFVTVIGVIFGYESSATQPHFIQFELRKFAEQYGDIIQWTQSNRAYIMTHGLSGIDWKHYKHPLPENVYDVYMKNWGLVSFTA